MLEREKAFFARLIPLRQFVAFILAEPIKTTQAPVMTMLARCSSQIVAPLTPCRIL